MDEQAANVAQQPFRIRFDDSNVAERSSPRQINPHWNVWKFFVHWRFENLTSHIKSSKNAGAAVFLFHFRNATAMASIFFSNEISVQN